VSAGAGYPCARLRGRVPPARAGRVPPRAGRHVRRLRLRQPARVRLV